MNIQLLSDLHLEFKPYKISVHPDAEVIVIAGDIIALGQSCVKLYHLENLIKHIKIPVVYIFGNHECYGGCLQENVKIVKTLEQKYPHFHFLYNEVFTYNGVDFIGTTLWTNFESMTMSKSDAMKLASMYISDFKVIKKEDGTLITPHDYLDYNIAAKKFIQSKVQGSSNKKVVVTHFVPTSAAVHTKYSNSPLNSYFICDCDYLFEGVDAWIFGHTHASHDFIHTDKHGNTTHLVCNPKGYPHEPTNFNKHKMIVV
jgi:predicted phosphodiesterase